MRAIKKLMFTVSTQVKLCQENVKIFLNQGMTTQEFKEPLCLVFNQNKALQWIGWSASLCLASLQGEI